MKKIMRHLRKPLSFLLALCMLLSAVTVGLTVWAEDITSKQASVEGVEALPKETWQSFEEQFKSDSLRLPDPNEAFWESNRPNATEQSRSYNASGAYAGKWPGGKLYDEMVKLILENYDFLYETFITKMPETDYYRQAKNYELMDDDNFTLARLQRLFWANWNYWRSVEQNWAQAQGSMITNTIILQSGTLIPTELSNRFPATYTTKGGRVLNGAEDLFTGTTGDAYRKDANAVERMLLIFCGYQKQGDMISNWENAEWTYCRIYEPADKSYLKYYPTVANIPSKVLTVQGTTTRCRSKYQTWPPATVYYNDDDRASLYANNADTSAYYYSNMVNEIFYGGASAGTPDTTSKGYLEAFQSVYTQDILVAEHASDLTAEQLKKLLDAGTQCLSNVIDLQSGTPKIANSVGDHFFKGALTYEEGTFTRALRLYNEAYAYAVDGYKKVIDSLKKYDGAYVLKLEDMDPLFDGLTNATTYYSAMNADQKNQVTAWKAVQDSLQGKYDAAKESLYTDGYTNTVNLLAEKLKSPFVNNVVINSDGYDWVLDDNIAGELKTIAELVIQAMQYKMEIDSTANTPGIINIYLTASLKQAMGASYTDQTKRVIEVLSGFGDGTTNEEHTVTVNSNPLLYTYNNISEIPPLFSYDTATFTFTFNADGVFESKKAMKVFNSQASDTTAMTNFHKWQNTVNNEFLTKDLSTVTTAELLNMRTALQGAMDTVNIYSTATRTHLLASPAATMDQALRRLNEINVAMANDFIKQVDYLTSTYSGHSSTLVDVDAIATFMELMKTAFGTWDNLTEDYKYDNTPSKNAYNALLALQLEYSTIEDSYNLQLYMKMANAMCAWWDYTNGIAKPLTMQDVTSLRSAIMAVDNRYTPLTQANKNTADVIAMQARRDVLAAAIDAFIGNPQWKQTNVEYETSIPNADKANVLGMIGKLDGIVDSDFVHSLLGLPDGQDFGDFVWGMLNENVFTGDMVTMLCKTLYDLLAKELIKNESQVGSIPTTVMLVDHLAIAYTPYWALNKGCIDPKYKNVIADIQRLSNAGQKRWERANWFAWDWVDYSDPANPIPVHDFDTFLDALISALAPIWPVVAALIGDHDVRFDITIVNELVFAGEPGYSDMIAPLLTQLGCKNLPDLNWVKDAASTSDAGMNREKGGKTLRGILLPLKDRINEIIDAPITGLMEILPALSYVINNDWLSTGLARLTSPLAAQQFDIMQMLKDAGIDLKDMNKFLKDFVGLGKLEINGVKVEVPDFNFGEIAGIANKSGSGGYSDWGIFASNGAKLTSNKDQMFIYFFRMLLDIVQSNQPLIDSFLATASPQIKALAGQALGNDKNDIINTVFGVVFPDTPTAFADFQGMNNWEWEKTNTEYVNGVTKGKAEQAIASVDALVKKIVPLILNMDLSDFAGGKLYTDALLNTIMNLYKTIGSEKNAAIVALLGIDFSKDKLANKLQAEFPSAAQALRSAANWDAVDFANVTWGISSLSASGDIEGASNKFAKGLAQALTPLNPILKTLLLGGDYDGILNGFLSIKGADGYNLAVQPLFSMLGCTTAPTKSDYVAAVNANEDNMIYLIAQTLFAKVNEITDSPVKNLASLLPNMSFFLNNKGITKLFYNLISPITNITDEVMSLFKNEDGSKPNVFEFVFTTFNIQLPFEIDWHDVDKSILPIVQSFLSNLNIGGTPYNFTLPAINWGTLAGHGTKVSDGGMWQGSAGGPSTYRIQADSGGTVYGLLTYVFQLLNVNKDTLLTLIDGLLAKLPAEKQTFIKGIIKTVLSQTDYKMSASAIIRALSLESPLKEDWDMSQFAQTASDLVYDNAELNDKRASEAALTADALISKLLPMFVPGAADGIAGLLASGIYTDDLVTTLFTAIYPNLSKGSVATIIDTIGLDINIETLITTFRNASYTSSADALSALLAKWNDPNSGVPRGDYSALDKTKLVWNVKDMDSFATAIATIVKPFEGIIKALLIETDFTAAGAYTIKGAQGYKEAVLPLLGALGCTSEDGYVMTYEQFKAEPDNVVKNIITTLLSHVEKIANSPLTSLASILPNFAYFMDNNGLTTSLMRLIKPITNIADELLPLLTDENGNVPEVFEFVVEALNAFNVKLPGGMDIADIEHTFLPFLQEILLKGFVIKPAVYQTDESGNIVNDAQGNPIVTTPAVTINIKLPDFDWKTIAGRGIIKTTDDAPFFSRVTGLASGKYKYVEAKKGDMITALLTYILQTVSDNKTEVMKVLDTFLTDTAKIKELVNALLSNSPQKIAEALIMVLSRSSVIIPDDEWNMDDFKHDLFEAVYRDKGDVTSETTEAAVGTVDKIVAKFLPMLLPEGTESLNGFVADLLYTDKMVSTIFTALYKAIGTPDVQKILSQIGFDASIPAIAAALRTAGYNDVAVAIEKAATWADVDLTGVSWGVDSRETFTKAITGMLSPFNELLVVLLAGQGKAYSLLDAYDIQGANGYRNAVLPLLAALGCNSEDGLLTADEFESKMEMSDGSDILSYIVSPVLGLLERVCSDPVTTIASILPNLAFFMDNGGLTRSVNNLIKPITSIADDLLVLFKTTVDNGDGTTTETVPTLIEFVMAILGGNAILPGGVDLADLEGSIVPLINSFTGNIQLKAEVKDADGNVITPAVKIALTLPEIDWHILAGCGTVKTNAEAPFYAKIFGSSTHWKYVEANIGDATITLLNYLARTLKNNSEALNTVLDTFLPASLTPELQAKIKGMVAQLLTNEEKDITSGLIAILSPLEVENQDWDMTDFIYDAWTAVYGEGIDSGRVNSAVAKLDGMVNDALTKFMGTNLTEIITSNLYTDKMTNTIFKAIFTAISGKDVAPIMDIIGFDVSLSAMADALADYPSVAAALKAATSWSDVNFDALAWNISDSDGFAHALAAMLNPFNDLLKALFVGGKDNSFTIAGAYTLQGSNGYESAILPLLAALGCNENVVSAEQFATQAASDSSTMIYNILKPILSLANKVAAAPVDTLARILPNFAFFLNNGGITKSVTKLLAPVANIADEVIALVVEPDADGKYPSMMEFLSGFIGDLGIQLPADIDITDIESSILPLINSVLAGIVIKAETYVKGVPGDTVDKDNNKLDENGNKIIATPAVKLNITLPELPLDALAGCGELVTNAEAPFWGQIMGSKTYKSVVVKTDKQLGDSTVTLLNYIATALTSNKSGVTELVTSLLSSMADGAMKTTIMKYLNILLNNSPEDIVAAIIKAIDLQSIDPEEWDMTDFVTGVMGDIYAGTEVDSDRTESAIDTIDDVLGKVIPMLTGGSLNDVVSTNLYTDKMVSTIFTALYKALDVKTVTDIFGILNIDTTLAAMQSVLTDKGYTAVATALGSASSWATLDLTNVSWGVADKATFANALATILTPFNEILNGLLTKTDVKIAGIYELKGNDGYADSVLPILAALGCNEADGLLSASDYKAALTGDSNDMMVNIIMPVLNFVDRVCGDPVNTLASILPNLAYFMDNGGLTKAITYLIKPLTNITDQIIPLVAEKVDGKYPTTAEFAVALLAELGITIPLGLDIADLENEATLKAIIEELTKNIAINGVKLNLQIPDFSWSKLSGCGTVKTTDTAPFYAKLFGSSSKWKYVEANKGDATMTLLNFIAKTLVANKTSMIDIIKSVFATMEPPMDAKLQAKILEMLTNLLNKDPAAISGAVVKVLSLTDVDESKALDIYTFLQEVTQVVYEDDIDANRVAKASITADNLIKNVLKTFMGNDLASLIGTNIYTDKMATTIFKALYGALAGAEDTMTKLGIDTSVAAVEAVLTRNGFGTVAAAINGKTWAEIKADTTDLTWNVKDAKTFAKALATMVVPFNGVLSALIADRDYSVLGAYTIKGANGYKNSIMPILGALGCTEILSGDDFKAAAEQSETAMMTNIIEPILAQVDKLAASPFTTLSQIGPNLAFFMDNGGLTKAVTNLLKPIENITDILVPLISAGDADTSLIGFVTELLGTLGVTLPAGLDLTDIEGSIVPLVNSILAGKDGTGIAINGEKVLLTLPEIDWSILAGCGTLMDNADAPFLGKMLGTSTYKYVQANPGDAMFTMLKYVARLLKTNDDAIITLVTSLLAGKNMPVDVIGMLTKLLKNNSEDDLANAIIRVLAATDIMDEDAWDMTDFIEGVYTDIYSGVGLDKDTVAGAVKKTDHIISKVFEKFLGGDANSLISKNLYTDALVNTIYKALYGAITKPDIADILAKLNVTGLDLSVSAVADNMRANGFTAVADAITAANSLTDADLTNAWGVNSSDSFAKALTAIVTPFNGVLKALLVGEDCVVLDSYTIKGANGYKTAVLPLLAALGCTEDDGLLSAEAFAKAANDSESALLENIINPVLNLVERIASSPVETLASIMPNLAYFMSNGGLTRCVNNLIKPISNIADDIIPLVADKKDDGTYPSLIEFAVEIISGIDTIQLPAWLDLTNLEGTLENAISSIIGNLTIKGATYNFTLPKIDWQVLSGCGEIITNADAPFLAKVIGSSSTWKYVKADTERSTMVILNYVAKLLTTNASEITKLLTAILADVQMDANLKNELINIIGKLLSNAPEDIVAALIKTINPADVVNDDWDMTGFIHNVYDATKENAIDEGRTTKAIVNLDTIINGVVELLGNMGTLPSGTTLTSLISDNLYTDMLPNLILNKLYPLLAGEKVAPIMATLGLKTSKDDVSAILRNDGFTVVADALDKAPSFGEVVVPEKAWNVSGGDTLSVAIAALLVPFNGVLGALLASQNYVVADIYEIKGADGYSNSVLPILAALGCTDGVKTADEYNAAVNAPDAKDTALLSNILAPIFKLVDKVALAPADMLTSILPNLAYFMSNGGLTRSIYNLIKPIENVSKSIIPLIAEKDADGKYPSLVDFAVGLLKDLGIFDLEAVLPDGLDIKHIEDSIIPVVNSILKGKDGTGITIAGKNILLQLPVLNWAELAGCGTVVDNADAPFLAKVSGTSNWKHVEANKADAFVWVLNYLTSTIETNAASLTPLITDLINSINLGDGMAAIKELLLQYVSNIMATGSKELTNAIIKILELDDIKDLDWNMSDVVDFAWKAYDAFEEEQYGDDVTPDTVNEAMKNADAMISNVLSTFLGGASLSDMINTNLYSDKMVTTIFNGLYSKLNTIADTMKTLGFDVSKDNMVEILSRNGFAAVADAVKANGFTNETLAWGINNNSDAFAKALATIFLPFDGVLKALLVKENYAVLDIYTIKGANGYANSILPLLGALGCTTDVMTASEFAAAADDSETAMLENILKPITALIDRVCKDPLTTLATIMPNISYFMQSGSLNKCIEALILPITNISDTLLPILTGKDDIETMDFVQELLKTLGITLPEGLDITNIADSIIPVLNLILNGTDGTGIVIKETYVKGVAGDKVDADGNKLDADGNKIIDTPQINLNFTLLEIDWAKLAGCGTLVTNAEAPFLTKVVGGSTKWQYVEANKADSLVMVLNYLVRTLQGNQSEIAKLVGGLLAKMDPAVVSVIQGLITDIFGSNSYQNITAALIKVFALPNVTNVGWTAKDFLHNVKTALYYYNDVQSGDVEVAINNLDSIIKLVMPSLLKTDLTTLIGKNLYTNSNVSMIAKAIFGAFKDQKIVDTITTIGIDVSIGEVSKQWMKYPSAVAALAGKTNWADVDFASIDWKVSDGNSLADAIGTVLAPFADVLGALLAGESFNIAGVYAIKGADGYSNAVLPILGALGCTDGVLTSEQYADSYKQNSANAVANIIKPIIKLVEKIAANPVNTVSEILPNLAFFLSNNGLTKSITKLIAPVENIAKQVLELVPSYKENPNMINFVLDLLGDLEVFDASTLSDILVNVLKKANLISQDTTINAKLDINNLENDVIGFVREIASKGLTISGKTIALKLPTFTWGDIAGHGTLIKNAEAPFLGKTTGSSDYSYVQSDKGDLVMAILNYIVQVAKDNQGTIFSLIGTLDPTIKGIIEKILSNETPKISGALVSLIANKGPGAFQWGNDFVWNFAQVMYPNGTDEFRVNKSVSTADKAITNALKAFLNLDLGTLAGGAIYTNANVSAIVKALYTALGSDAVAPILAQLGLDFSMAGVASGLYGYDSAMAAIASAGSWANVNFGAIDWRATTPDGFANALAAALRPLNPILSVLFGNDSFAIAGGIEIKGNDGYKNAIYPLLTALGCTTVLNPDQYAAAVRANPDNMIGEIVKPITALVSRVAASPLMTIAEILPNIAYFIDNDGVLKLVDSLIRPITGMLGYVPELLGNGSIIDIVLDLVKLDLPIDLNNIEGSIVPLLNSIIGKIPVKGKPLGIQLPDINWGTLAGHGQLKNNGYVNYVESNTGDTMVAMLRYIFSTLSYGNNPNAIKALVGSDATINQIIGNVINGNPNDLIKMIVDLLAPTDKNFVGNVTYKPIKTVETQSTPNLVKDDFALAITILDGMIPQLATDMLKAESLNKFVGNLLYTRSLMTTAVSAIFGLLDPAKLGIDILDLLKKAGFDLTPSGIATQLTEGKYSGLRNQLEAAGNSWKNVDYKSLNWGFKDGDKDGFIGQLVALLRPISPVLSYVLGGTDLVLLDSVTLKGSNGYSNTVVPLLEALNCNGVLSVNEYNKRAAQDPDNLLLSITTPLFDKVDQLLDKPIDTLTEVLPNIGYFMYNKNAAELVENAMLPITDLLETIAPVYELNIDLSVIANFDLIKTLNGVIGGIKISGQSLGIKLIEFDWAQLAGRGTSTKYTSERLNASGGKTTATKIVADKPWVLLTVLRYIVSNLQDPANLASIKTLLAGLNLGDISDIIGMILDMLATTDRDEIIEFIFSLLLGIGGGARDPETPKPVVNPVAPQETPKGGLNTPVIIALSVGAAILVAGGFLWLLALLRKKKEGEQIIDASM